MASAKTPNESHEKTESAPVVTGQPPTPEKLNGPQQVGRRTVTASSAPNESSSAVQRAGVLGPAAQARGAGARAQMMTRLQRSVGTARVNRMLAAAPAAGKEKKEEQSQLTPRRPGAAVQTLSMSQPDDPSEKEAEAVSRNVTSGQNASPITPLSSQAAPIHSEKDETAEDNKPTPPPDWRPESEAATPVMQKMDSGSASEANPEAAADVISNKGAGSPVDDGLRRTLEPRMGADLSGARVHRDSRANDAADAINARAFTHGQDIFLARGESENDTGLMAHELTHVVQQSSAGPTAAPKVDRVVQSKGAAEKPAPEIPVAPGVLELKGMKDFPAEGPVKQFLEAHKGSDVMVKTRFGELAQGELKVKQEKDGDYQVKPQALPLAHPIFARVAEAAPGLGPSLIVEVRKNKLMGYVGMTAAAKLPKDKLENYIEKAPELIGLVGFTVPNLKMIKNKLEGGQLHLGLSNVDVKLGSAFSGTVNFEVTNEEVKFDGRAKVVVKGLAEGTLELKRTENVITGKASVALELPANFTGALDVEWDGSTITGEGKVGYTGEKLTGEVTLRLMEKGEAAKLEKEKKAPPEAAGKEPAVAAKAPAKKPKQIDYVVFGEGDLTFAFNEWLNGTAHVIVDPKGFVTIIGKITPQKEFELFEQKDFIKPLFKFEARAAYGIPVVGNIFIFANVGMDAFAKLGPAKFYNIVVDGTYSTDPEKNKDFSIKGSINISAAAGLRLRAEAGAGLEILGHDIKAGAGINGIAGIKGYAEATPVIGYREKGAPGEDKNGEFYIRGDLEIAAQPFLGLSGDLFIELDTPWWSPLSDDKWTWPLFDKEYPIGGTLGVVASVDYVFGSKQWPAIEFKPVEFDATKFMTDLYHDKTKPKTAEAGDKPGEWKEKNEAATEPPKPDEGKGDAKPGELGEQTPARSKVEAGGAKGPEKHVDDKTKVGDKTVEEHKKKALEEGKKDPVTAPQGAEAKDKADEKEKVEPDHEKKWERGVKVVTQALEYAEKEGIELPELNKILSKIRKRPEFGFTELYAEPDEDQWIVKGSMSAARKVTTIPNKRTPKANIRPDENVDPQTGDFAPHAKKRIEWGLPPAGSPEDRHTVARLRVGRNVFWGRNAHGRSVTLTVNPISETHAEADVLQQASDAGATGKATLVVDRALCRPCGDFGAVKSMARQIGLEALTIITPKNADNETLDLT